METDRLSFLSDTLPEGWEQVLEREKTIRQQRQIDVENASRHAFESGALSKYQPVRTLMSAMIPKIIDNLKQYFDKIGTNDGKAKYYKKHLIRLKNENYEAYVYIAMMTMIDSAARVTNMSVVMNNIMKNCEYEAEIEHWHNTAKKFFEFVYDQARKNTDDAVWIRKGLSVAMNRYIEGKYGDEGAHPEAKFEPWSSDYRDFVAKTLYEAIMVTTPLFEVLQRRYSANQRMEENYNKLAPSKELIEWIGDANVRLGLQSGFYLPIPIKPRHWTNTQNGGFWTRYGGQLKLVKSRNEAYQEEILEQPEAFATCFKTVNAAQDTAWRINPNILEVIRELIYEGKEIAGLPPADDLPLPPCPKCHGVITHGIDHPCFADKAVLKEWKDIAHETYKTNVSNRGKRLRLALSMETAELLSEDKQFFFVYQTDFRGRLYPCSRLSPQGTDAEKGMLEFAEGVPLGEHGAWWLAVHCANCWGEDKIDYSARVKWTKDNTDWIIECAVDPLRHRAWCDADSPFMFLAACMEWAKYIEYGESYESHIPVGLDGSCSGIQHYSALLRDEVGALATNVKAVPNQTKKSDIYGMVAEETVKQFKEDLVGEDQEKAKHAMFLLSHNAMNRKITKRAVMTLPYGSTFQACKTYVSDALNDIPEIKKLKKEEKKPLFNYASKTVWECIPKVVKGARQGMDYLKGIARLVAKSMAPVTWQTPTGFIVHQSYYLSDVHVIHTVMNGNIVMKVKIGTESKFIDKAHQVSGIAPNFIHSLDASHLMFSVCAAVDKGINAFALVHDSLGTHAGRTEEFFYLLREQFYLLYKNHQPLHQFLKNVKPLIQPDDLDKVGEPPIIGTLCLEDILNAKFLFS